MTLCVIPARGGSKRIPRTNVRPFHGRPLIAWPIPAALESRIFDHVIVSTDDEAIAETARAEGADVPFMRPADLSDDHTPTVPVRACDGVDRPVCGSRRSHPHVADQSRITDGLGAEKVAQALLSHRVTTRGTRS